MNAKTLRVIAFVLVVVGVILILKERYNGKSQELEGVGGVRRDAGRDSASREEGSGNRNAHKPDDLTLRA